MATLATTNGDAVSLDFYAIQIENFMRIEFFRVEARGQHLVLSGPNKAGKTSILEGIFSALSGRRAAKLEEPIRHGAAEAHVHLELADQAGKVRYLIDRYWKSTENRLVVSAPDGSRFTRPQELVDSFFDDYCLDPSKFLMLKPSDQVDEVLRVCGVEPPADKVKEITGEELAPLEGESAAAYLDRLVGSKTGLLYYRRQERGKELERKQKAWEDRSRSLAQAAPVAPGLSMQDLLKQRDSLIQKQKTYRAVAQSAEDVRLDHKAATHKLAILKADQERCHKTQETLKADIAELQRRLAESEKQSLELASRIEKGEAYVADITKELEAQDDAVKTLKDPAPEIDQVDAQIGKAQQVSAAAAKRAADEAELERLAAEAKKAKDEHSQLDLWIERIRELRPGLLEGLDLGVGSLQVNEGELQLNGHPFTQASQAERIIVATQISFKRNPKLRILRIDNAELLDQDSRRIVQEMASRAGFQTILSQVRDNNGKGLQFELVEAITDGEAA